MPSLRHELIVDLFRQDPQLLLRLVEEALGPLGPPYTAIQIAEANLTQVLPAELRADLVLLLLIEGRPVFALIVEVQLGRDGNKRYAWPLYWAAERARRRCPVALLVIAGAADVATWAREPIDDGHRGGGTLCPLVLSPAHIPVLSRPEQVRGALDLGILSLVAHAEEPVALEVADAVLQGLLELAEPQAKQYYDVVVALLHELTRKKLLEKPLMEALMKKYSDHLKGLYEERFAEGLAEGERRGEQRGELRGEQRGELRGEQRGELRGERKAILQAMQLRGISLDPDAQARIQACEDLAQLDRWFARALTAKNAADLFAGD